MGVREEIHEQPETLARLLDHRDEVEAAAKRLRSRRPRYILLAARGTSDNAARYALYLWGGRNRLSTALAAPSLFRTDDPPRLDGAAVVAISQSGASPDLVRVVEVARGQGCHTLAITNDRSSPLALAADDAIALHAGNEEAVAATKTYTAELLAVALMSVAFDPDPADIAALQRLPGAVGEALGHDASVAAAAGDWHDLDRGVVLGRGVSLATAHEWALKLQELADVVAQPLSTADFQHGPVALVGPGFGLLAVVSAGASDPDIFALLERLKSERGCRVLLLSNDSRHRGPRLVVPAGTPNWLFPLVAIVPAQLFCHHLAVARGLDPDAPRGLSKVTRTH